MRKLMRSIARYKMTQAGIEHLNDRPWVVKQKGKMKTITRDKSIFSKKWREYATMPLEKIENKNSKKKKLAK